jgi:uncharacterized protein
MKGGLPEQIDPLRLAEAGARLCGQLPVTRLARLRPLLSQPEGEIEVTADFGIDEQATRWMHLQAHAALPMICQRCMGPMTVTVNADTTLAFLTSESEAQRLGNRYEPYLLSAGKTSLMEMVEDELLLRMPMIPKHEGPQACTGAEPAPEKDEADRESPFAVLAGLRDKR